MGGILALFEVLSKLSPLLVRIGNMFMDKIEANPVANADWQKLRERVFYKYEAPANAAQEANEIEADLEQRVRSGSFGKPT